ncbi:MAG: chromosomal replication initiator protein DnaA [Acetobacter sp.]|nr:chromosomal replication initiator protein DnaA [Bacteroides sp.]MCM1340371.1 chromosomal replication initiator protein DnaA [Acetobacter sp.]MCM1432982.1 chromosomal replication initiator protein DnaA [Clostridiales bacterium]
METYNEIWLAVLEYFKPPHITETAYNLWIKNIEFVGFDGKTVTVNFERKLNHDIFITQYKDAFCRTFKEVIGFDVEISCLCDEPLDEKESSKGDSQLKLPYQEKHLEDYKNEQFTFENFIVGPSNRFAYAAAKAVASDPAGMKKESTFSNYNPLFIYGNSGLGKTHILNAICNEIKNKFPEMNILYVKAEQFTNEFLQSLQYKTTDEFHNKYRDKNIDVFLVDDIQFIAGKDSTVEEFFHTFDNFVYSGKQVVLTSDRPPRDIQSITDRLRSRFEDGLIADVQEPELETKCEIIKRKAMLLNFKIEDDVVEFIAKNIKTNIRQLEGVTKKLYALCDINNHKPTIALAKSVIKIVVDDTQQPLPITIQKIVEEVSRTTGVTTEDIYSKRQKSNISHARQITFYVIRKVTNMSLEEIGEEFNKHHSTVMYSISQIEEEIKQNSKLSRQINDMINNIKNN